MPPNAPYFNVGRIGRDQMEDWARRQAFDAEQAARLLSPVLE